jgi:hypothetical protein
VSWFNSIRTAVLGVDVDAAQADYDRANSQLAALNAAKEWKAPADSYDFNAEVGEAFNEGLGEGADRLRRGGNAVFGTTLKTIFRALPWPVWLVLIAAAAFYLWPLIKTALKARKAIS